MYLGSNSSIYIKSDPMPNTNTNVINNYYYPSTFRIVYFNSGFRYSNWSTYSWYNPYWQSNYWSYWGFRHHHNNKIPLLMYKI